MPNTIGYSFQPGSQDVSLEARPSGPQAQAVTPVQFRTMRLPNRNVPGAIAANALLQSPGGGGMPDVALLQMLMRLFAPQGGGIGLAGPTGAGLAPAGQSLTGGAEGLAGLSAAPRVVPGFRPRAPGRYEPPPILSPGPLAPQAPPAGSIGEVPGAPQVDWSHPPRPHIPYFPIPTPSPWENAPPKPPPRIIVGQTENGGPGPSLPPPWLGPQAQLPPPTSLFDEQPSWFDLLNATGRRGPFTS